MYAGNAETPATTDFVCVCACVWKALNLRVVYQYNTNKSRESLPPLKTLVLRRVNLKRHFTTQSPRTLDGLALEGSTKKKQQKAYVAHVLVTPSKN